MANEEGGPWAHGMRIARRLAAELPGIPVEVTTLNGFVVVEPD